jgi:hypothetical protein
METKYYYLDDSEECYDYILEEGLLGNAKHLGYITYKDNFNMLLKQEKDYYKEEIKKLIYYNVGHNSYLIGYQLISKKLIKRKMLRDSMENTYWNDFIVWGRKNKINKLMKL